MGESTPSSNNRSASALRVRPRSAERVASSLPARIVGGRYRVVKRAGEGISAKVYFAEDIRTHQPVVVKQLTVQAARDSGLATRFMHEVHAIARINHPNVVRIIDYGAPAYEQPYLVMESLPGETLSRLLARQGNLNFDLAMFLCRQAATGLIAVHRTGTVHRDVKPDNLYLVGPIGKPSTVKIIDFGMAKLPDNRNSLGDGRFVVGTLQYMPPEQVLADPVDARADVYSLGIVMFRLFTGHLPFDVEAGLDLLGHQLFSPLPPPSWLNEAVNPSLESIILRATRKHPQNRYQTMAALLSDLDGIDGTGREPTATAPERCVEPDEYVPLCARGQEIAEGLAQRFGPNLVTLAAEANETPGSAQPFALARKR